MKTEKEREFTFSATFSLQSLSSDLKVPSITNRFSFDSKSYLVYGMKTYPTCDSPLKAFFHTIAAIFGAGTKTIPDRASVQI